MDENTVLADKRHQIGKRRKRHDVQVILEIDLGIGRLFQQGMNELEGHTCAAKIVKTRRGPLDSPKPHSEAARWKFRDDRE